NSCRSAIRRGWPPSRRPGSCAMPSPPSRRRRAPRESKGASAAPFEHPQKTGCAGEAGARKRKFQIRPADVPLDRVHFAGLLVSLLPSPVARRIARLLAPRMERRGGSEKIAPPVRISLATGMGFAGLARVEIADQRAQSLVRGLLPGGSVRSRYGMTRKNP